MKPPHRTIAKSGPDKGVAHRTNFTNCPHCDHEMKTEQWDKAAVTLVLQPARYRAGCVSLIAECPKCFERSWIHTRMGGFGWSELWPALWRDAVKDQESKVRLQAARDWGVGLCWNCQHLTGASIEYHAWRDCIVGSGPPRTTCPKFKQLKS